MSGRALLAGLACVLVAGAAQAQHRFLAVGATSTGGIVGVEYIRHVETAPVGFAVGVGVTGAGARLQLRLREDPTDIGFETRYVSAGVLVQPIPGNRPLGAVVMATVEYGIEIVGAGLYMSAGGGGGVGLGPGASPLVPSLRVVFGASL